MSLADGSPSLWASGATRPAKVIMLFEGPLHITFETTSPSLTWNCHLPRTFEAPRCSEQTSSTSAHAGASRGDLWGGGGYINTHVYQSENPPTDVTETHWPYVQDTWRSEITRRMLFIWLVLCWVSMMLSDAG